MFCVTEKHVGTHSAKGCAQFATNPERLRKSRTAPKSIPRSGTGAPNKMNKSTTLLAVLAVIVLSSPAFAYSPNSTRHQEVAAKLVPSKIVNPTDLPRSFMRSTVNIEFSVDASGQPRDITVHANADRAVKDQIAAAFSQWRFDLTQNTSNLETKRFVLPLEIVPQA